MLLFDGADAEAPPDVTAPLLPHEQPFLLPHLGLPQLGTGPGDSLPPSPLSSGPWPLTVGWWPEAVAAGLGERQERGQGRRHSGPGAAVTAGTSSLVLRFLVGEGDLCYQLPPKAVQGATMWLSGWAGDQEALGRSLTLGLRCVCAKSLQSCLTLCDPVDHSPPGSSVHGVLQAEYWSGLLNPLAGALPDSGIEPAFLTSPAIGRWVLYH